MHISRATVENTLFIALLAFAPLALASVHTWAFCVIAFVSLVIFNIHFLADIDAFKRVIKRPESIGAFVFLAVSLLYITPLPPAAVKLLSPHTWALWQNYTIEPPKLMTLSIYVHETMLYIIKFTAYFMVFLVVASKIRGEGGSQSAERKAQSESLWSERYALCSMRYAYILLGALCAVLSILFHSLSDFNLHVPANALYFTVMLAIITGISQSAKSIAHSEYSSSERSALSAPRSADSFSLHSSGPDTRYPILDTKFLNLLVNSIILIAFTIAVFGMVQKLSYNGKIYWLIEKAGDHFGPYVNYDHFAGFMEMCALFTVAVFIGNVAASSFSYTKKWTDKIVWLSTKEANKALMYLFAAVVMTTSLFMTTSRGGIMSFVGALAVMYFTCVISAAKKMRNRILLASALVVILIAIMFAWVGPEETISRFEALQTMIKTFINERSILSEIRPFFWKDTLTYIKDFPITGTGLGTYSFIFQEYRTFPSYYGFLMYAHNDYLQFFAETGAVGGVFLAGFLVWYVRRFRGCIRGLRESV